LRKNRVVILFLVRFFAVYFALTVLYSFYLHKTQISSNIFSCAPITKVITQHAKNMVELLGYDVFTQQNKDELSMMFQVNQKYVVKIVEGCSSIGVVILFLAFIIAFAGKLKATLLFGVFGIIMIYIVNIFRIVFLVLVIYHFPQFQEVLHDLVFPAIIYGMVLILWFFWIRYYAIRNKRN
jgi:exosortase family protein XrtF